MSASKPFALLALLGVIAAAGCAPEPTPEEPVAEDSDFDLEFVSGAVWDLYIDDFGCSLSSIITVYPGQTIVHVWYKKTYPSGETYQNYDYEFQVDSLFYDAERFYLVLTSEDVTFEVEADYLPPDPNDSLENHLWTEGQMTVYYGPFKETFPLATDLSDGPVWEVFYYD